MAGGSSIPTPREEFLEDLMVEISEPVHKRIVKAYLGDSPVASMEAELGRILLEVLRSED